MFFKKNLNSLNLISVYKICFKIDSSNHHTNKKNGFSLIELLIVIVIIGILASISSLSYSTYKERAKETVTKSILVSARQLILGNRAFKSKTEKNEFSTIKMNGKTLTAAEFSLSPSTITKSRADKWCVSFTPSSQNRKNTLNGCIDSTGKEKIEDKSTPCQSDSTCTKKKK